MRVAVAGSDREQVQVVVAEHCHGGVAEAHYLSDDAKRVRTAIDEVAVEPQPVVPRRKADHPQKLVKLRVATLDVTDSVKRNCCQKSEVRSQKVRVKRTMQEERSARRAREAMCLR